jgi:FkbM family methyltransferase
MLKLGTNYGGWAIPKDINLNKDSIIYSGGIGEDISFDLLLSDKYNCNILLVDPTKRAKIHYNEIINYYKTNVNSFTGDIQKDYLPIIQNLKPNFDKINYLNIGIWDKEEDLKFYKQSNEQYVSQSLINGMFSNNYEIVKTKSIKQIMNANNHNKIDLLKLDIEGAEIKVLEQMLIDKIYPRYLCIEFDLYLKKKDTNNETKNIINKLLNIGYKILVNDKMNITFVKL